jgi:hypothetical protein
MSCTVRIYKFANQIAEQSSLFMVDFLDAVEHVTAQRIKEEFNNQSFGARKRSAGLIFKQLVEATLQHRGWKLNQPFYKQKVKNLRPSSFSFGKEFGVSRVAASWGFGNAIGITSVVLSTLFTKTLKAADAWHPDCYFIMVGSAEFNRSLGLDTASATSEQFLAALRTLESELPVPTVLISLEEFKGLKVTETSSPLKVTSVELTE